MIFSDCCYLFVYMLLNNILNNAVISEESIVTESTQLNQ